MAIKITGLDAKDRDALLAALLAKYEKEPEAVERTLPEAAQILQRLLPSRKPPRQYPLPALTEREKEVRLRSFREKVAHSGQKGKALPKEAAIEALEDAAALTESSLTAALELENEHLAKLVRLVTGLPLGKKGRPARWVRQEGEAARVVSILRGVRCHLTWDKRLLAIEIDPKQIALGKKAMKFVGTGRDPKSDVAERHDDYLAGVVE